MDAALTGAVPEQEPIPTLASGEVVNWVSHLLSMLGPVLEHAHSVRMMSPQADVTCHADPEQCPAKDCTRCGGELVCLCRGGDRGRRGC